MVLFLGLLQEMLPTLDEDSSIDAIETFQAWAYDGDSM